MVNSSGAINQNPVRLHLGCGRKVKEGYLNIDAHVSAPGILRMDIFNLDFQESSIDEIFTEHMLEHLSKFEVPLALQEWARVLKPDGKLVMNLPNLEWCLREWLAKPESDRWGWQLDTIFGLQTHPGEFHKTGFTKPRLMYLLREAGFNHITIEDYWSHEQGCFWVEASKIATSNSSDSESVNSFSNAASANYQQSAFAESAKRVIERANYPAIVPIAASPDRPFWSVMIPVFNPQYDYLRQMLESLLVQAPAESEMQIEVVDDCSTEGDIEAWVKAIGQGRITYTRQPQNLGLLPNWNDCIKRAKGQWIHLLHQDDMVLPEFYNRLFEPLTQNEDLGAAFCRHYFMDKFGNRVALETLERETAGKLDGWLERISERQRIQFASIVVRRSTYETLGGYDSRSGSAADWEMWRRIAACYPVWYEPEPLACFRIHALSESSRLTRQGQNIDDIRRSIELAKAYLPPEKANLISQQALERYAHASLQHAERMLQSEDTNAAIALIQQGLLCSQSAEVQSHLNRLLLSNFRYPTDRFKPLRIVIDGVFFQRMRTGIARVWQSLLEEWAVNGFAQHLTVLDRDGTAPKIPGIRYRTIPRHNYDALDADRQMLQQVCDEEQAGLFISTYYSTPLHTPAVMMVYDMIPEMQQGNLSLPMWQEKHHCIRYADRYLSISENTARDLVNHFPEIPSDRVTVAHCGFDPDLQPATTVEVEQFRTKYGITQPYFLLVGGRSWYKNALLFFQAYAQLPNKAEISVVCTGPIKYLEEEFQPYVTGSQVHTLCVTDDELRLAYAGALALVYPSRYEGFGLPILEAMACGCPVITCNNSSIPEVAGDAVIYVSEDDPTELAEVMTQIVQQPELRDRLTQAGFDRLPQFSWERMAAIVSQTLAETANLPLEYSEGLPRSWVSVPRLLEQFAISPGSFKVIDQLRQARQQWLQAWMTVPPENLAEADAGELGFLRRSFLEKSFCMVELTAAEQSDFQMLTDKLNSDLTPLQKAQVVLTMLLYRPAHRLPLPPDLLTIPADWHEELVGYLLKLPPYFTERGEAELYCRYLEGLTNYLHDNITCYPDSANWQQIALIFTLRANFAFSYFAEGNRKEVYVKRAEILEHYLTTQGYELDYEFPMRSPDRQKIRLGVLSAHFSPQSETFASLPAYKHLNRDQYEIILFSLAQTDHRLEKYCAGHADDFVALPLELTEQVQIIRQADLDAILITTNVTAAANSTALLSLHRLARIQIANVCSCVSTGMRNVDYYISGKLTDAEAAQEQYSEALLSIEGPSHCYDYGTEENVSPTETLCRADLSIDEDEIVYISGANFFKITPEVEEVWIEILRQVKRSRLILYPFNPNWSATYPRQAFLNRIYAHLQQVGVEKNRVILLEPAPSYGDVKQRLKLADVYLDSFPFSGVTSLLDPLQVGLPTIVMDGNTFRSRMGPAFLRELSMPELIASNEQEYVKLAVQLGTNAEQRQQKQQAIEKAMQRNPRFTDSRYHSEQIGTLLQQLVEQQQQQSLQQAFSLRQTNLIAFPDWNQPEEELFATLADLLRFALTHPDRQELTLLISSGDWNSEDADNAISSVLLYLMSEEGIEAESASEIVLIEPHLVTPLLIQRITHRIALDGEDQAAIRTQKANSLPILSI